MNSPVAPESTRDKTDFTSAVSVVSISTLSQRDVGLSSVEAMMSLDSNCHSHFGRGFGGFKGNWGLCTSSIVSTVVSFVV